MKVRVNESMQGYFDHIRRHEGDVFVIPDEPRRPVSVQELQSYPELKRIIDGSDTVPQAFSANWMTPVANKTPEKTSTAQQQIDKKHDEEMAGRFNTADESLDDDTGQATSDVDQVEEDVI